MKSKAFERFINTLPVWLPLSRVLHHFSIIFTKQRCALKLLRIACWDLENKLLKTDSFD